MKRRSVYFLIASILTMLVPSPGRFVYGVTRVLELNLLMLIGTLSISLIKKIKMEELNTVLVLVFIISGAILYRQIMIMLWPEVMLTLGYLVYLMPVSVFLMGYIFNNMEQPLGERLKLNILHITTFSVYALLFFLLRDLAGYGTFTFFGKNHQIFESEIIKAEHTSLFSLLASVPGALILSSILLFIHIFIRNKFSVIKNAEAAK